MTKPAAAKRDVRLLVALLLFVISLIATLVQAWVVMLFVDAAVMGDWTYFSELFSVDPPAAGPVSYCLDYCAAPLPFLPGWVGIVSFGLGLLTLFYSWLKPRPYESNDSDLGSSK
jgi:hypothetical protein